MTLANFQTRKSQLRQNTSIAPISPLLTLQVSFFQLLAVKTEFCRYLFFFTLVSLSVYVTYFILLSAFDSSLKLYKLGNLCDLQSQASAVESLVRAKIQHKETIILCLEDCSDWSNATTRRVVMQVGSLSYHLICTNPL